MRDEARHKTGLFASSVFVHPSSFILHPSKGPVPCEALMHETHEPVDLCDYLAETLRQDGEFILSRGRHRRPGEAGPPTVLLVTPLAERPAPASLRRMEQEYSSRAELDPGWAAQPLALVPHNGRTVLVLADPGGEPLDRLLGSLLELAPFLRL